jgi:hypothetical protein
VLRVDADELRRALVDLQNDGVTFIERRNWWRTRIRFDVTGSPWALRHLQTVAKRINLGRDLQGHW